MEVKNTDILIIGAGPSGCVSASIFAHHGFKVLIVEKQRFPRFVIGESLLPRSMDNLEKAGFLDDIKSAGFQKKYGARFNWGDDICDFDFSKQYTKGWSWTWQVQRSEFDHILVKSVQKKGVEVVFGTAVTSVSINEDGLSESIAKMDNGKILEINAKFIVDASGYGRVLPKLMNLEKASALPSRTSFFSHLKEPNRDKSEEGHINILIDNKDVWGWIIPFSNNTSSVGLAGTTALINQFDGSHEEQFNKWIDKIPILKKRFSSSQLLFEPKKISGYSTAVTKLNGKGYVLTGNSSEFLDPVFSSGVTFATESGRLAAELVIKELKGEVVNWDLEYTEYLNYGIDVFRTYIIKWYEGKLQKIFFSKEKNEMIGQQICSVLAGYVWDKTNPFVSKGGKLIDALETMV